jgi:ElaB/YqjD/DUF883 family membrane-anchored ribosome-binding protein
MGETPDDIKKEIEQARERLGADLNRLEYHVKRELDWRSHYERSPWAFVGGAFGIAFLLGWISVRPRTY